MTGTRDEGTHTLWCAGADGWTLQIAPDPADDDKPEADQKRPWPLPKGWNGDGSKISIVGERPERYSDESLATMTLKRSGMAANEYIAAENWPNLSHRKKPRYVEMASASSKLPINRCALVRKEASAELSSSVEDRAVSVQQSLFEASIERADLLAKRIREISVEGSVRHSAWGCQGQCVTNRLRCVGGRGPRTETTHRPSQSI